VASEDAGDQAVWLVLVNVEVLHSLWPKSNRSITFTADGQKPVNGTNGWEVFKHGTRTERGQCCHSCRGLRCAFEYFADGYRDAGCRAKTCRGSASREPSRLDAQRSP